MRKRRIAYRLNGDPDKRTGGLAHHSPHGPARGQRSFSNDGGDHTIAESWELLFVMNAKAPAPYKFTDEELALRMSELFPRKVGSRIMSQPNFWRGYYNSGLLHPQRFRNGGQQTPPRSDLWSYRYIRTEAPQRTGAGGQGGQGEELPDPWPFRVAAISTSGKFMYMAYPPEPEEHLRRLSLKFHIPKQDWEQFPFPKEARQLYNEIKRERVEAQRQAFQAFCSDWLAKQRAERPEDFDPLLWKDPKW